MTSLPEILDDIKKLTLEAAEKIRRVSFSPEDVSRKGDGSPVTMADRVSHDVICEGLRSLTPEVPVISEEGDTEHAARISASEYWLVDPLDGTKEFLRGNGEYTVNIALVEQGVPVLGVVSVPALRDLYWACAGHGAFKKREDEGESHALSASGTDTPLTAVVSRSHPSRETNLFLQRLPVKRTLAKGSSVKLCAVAEGSADLYARLGPTYLWDTAAGAVIAREAGANVVDVEGTDLVYSLRDGLKQKNFVVYSPKTCMSVDLFGAGKL